jgi:hypothetical protein
MKKVVLLALALALSVGAQAQKNKQRKYDALFISAHVDFNQLFNIVDNPRMENDTKGLNYRLEVGAMDKYFEAFVFWEDFPAQDYFTYGLGLNGILTPWDSVFISAGFNSGLIQRDYLGNSVYLSFAAQVKAGIHISRNFILIADGEAKQRPDIGKPYILQFKGGLRYLIKNKGRERNKYR